LLDKLWRRSAWISGGVMALGSSNVRGQVFGSGGPWFNGGTGGTAIVTCTTSFEDAA